MFAEDGTTFAALVGRFSRRLRVSTARLTPVLALAWVGCGPNYPESEYPSAPPEGVTPDPMPPEPAPPGTIWRRDVVQVVDAGLGGFLQRVEVEPEKMNGAFVGFRIAALKPAAWWQGIDLAVGDVVTAINGMPIEQPAQAHAAFEALRSAERLVVRYLRGGELRELMYRIQAQEPQTEGSAEP